MSNKKYKKCIFWGNILALILPQKLSASDQNSLFSRANIPQQRQLSDTDILTLILSQRVSAGDQSLFFSRLNIPQQMQFLDVNDLTLTLSQILSARDRNPCFSGANIPQQRQVLDINALALTLSQILSAGNRNSFFSGVNIPQQIKELRLSTNAANLTGRAWGNDQYGDGKSAVLNQAYRRRSYDHYTYNDITRIIFALICLNTFETSQTAIKLLVEFKQKNLNADINDLCTRQGNTLLHIAAYSGNEFLVLFLCDQKNVHKENYFGKTPRQIAHRNGQFLIASFLEAQEHQSILLQKQDNKVQKQDDKVQKPLNGFSKRDCVNVLNRVYGKKTYGGKPCSSRHTYNNIVCIIFALIRSNTVWASQTAIKLLEEFKQKNPNVDINDLCTGQGNTLLHVAVESGNEALVIVLLKRWQVDATKKNHFGKTPCQIARERGWL
ncbi:MAG: ankyrin repeat domain-containing protein, partial [Puniceicoccales bacterium]|nr:ankyrin repeat domain-containing protein [Puniceicoccales bacterium]